MWIWIWCSPSCPMQDPKVVLVNWLSPSFLPEMVLFFHSSERMDGIPPFLFFFFPQKNTCAMIWWSSVRNKCARNNTIVWSNRQYPLWAVLCNFQPLSTNVLPPVGVPNSSLIHSDTKSYNCKYHLQFSHLYLLLCEVSSTVCYCTFFTLQQLFLNKSLCRKFLWASVFM